MDILSILGKGFKAMINEANTPESFNIGLKFEEYVRTHLFISNYFVLLERAHDANANKDFIKSSLKPDFTFLDKRTKKEFYVEVKFRKRDCHGKVIWCDDKQLTRYNEYNKEKPFFLMLGMGDKPNHPELVSLIPLEQAKHTGLFYSLVDEFEIDPGEPVLSKTLWSR